MCVIIDPIKEKVTHLVVEDSERPGLHRLVPIKLVHGTRNDGIEIRCSAAEFKELDALHETAFVSTTAPDAMDRLRPHLELERPASLSANQGILEGKVAVRRGIPVLAADGSIGEVDELIIDRRDGRITHLVLREAHLWGSQDISIPFSEIESLGEDSRAAEAVQEGGGRLAQDPHSPLASLGPQATWCGR